MKKTNLVLTVTSNVLLLISFIVLLVLCIDFTNANSEVGLMTKNEYIFNHIYMPLAIGIITFFAGFVTRKAIKFDAGVRKVDSICNIIVSAVTIITAVVLMIALKSTGLYLIGTILICINALLMAYAVGSIKNKSVSA